MKATWGSFAALMACAALAGCTCHQAGYYDPITGLVYAPGPGSSIRQATSWIKCDRDDDDDHKGRTKRTRVERRRPRPFGSPMMTPYPNTVAPTPAAPGPGGAPTGYYPPQYATGCDGAIAASPCGCPPPAVPGGCPPCGEAGTVTEYPPGTFPSGSGPVVNAPVACGDCPSCANGVADPSNLAPVPECSSCAGAPAPQPQPSGCSQCGQNHGGAALVAPGTRPGPASGNMPSDAPDTVPPPPTTEPVPAPPAKTSWQFRQPVVPQPLQLPLLPGPTSNEVRQASHASKWVPRSLSSGQ